MKQNYDKSFELVIGHEGGYTTHREDRGNWDSGTIGLGELKGTKYGISAMAYPKTDIKNLTLEQAKAIYKRDYWDKASCDELPSGLDFMVFDCVVNHGISRGVSMMQEAVKASGDGRVGPQTLKRVSMADPREALIEMAAIRGIFYSKLKKVNVFGRGWYRRQVKVLAEALDFLKEPALDQSNVKPKPLFGLFRRV